VRHEDAVEEALEPGGVPVVVPVSGVVVIVSGVVVVIVVLVRRRARLVVEATPHDSSAWWCRGVPSECSA